MTPLERAARAVAEEIKRQGIYSGPADNLPVREPIQAWTVDGNVDLQAIARAVLEAVRKPDEGMLRAGFSADHRFQKARYSHRRPYPVDLERDPDPNEHRAYLFTAMIDHILK